MLDVETNATSRQLPSCSHQNSKMTAAPSLSPPFHSSDDEFLLTSFWLSHYLVSQLLFLRHSLFDLQPSANQRRGGRSGAGPGPGGRGLSPMIFSTLDSPPSPASGLQGGDSYAQLDDFTRKASISRSNGPRHRASLPVCCPAFSSTVELFFFSPGPSVESSRVLTALSLRLQVDFSPLLVFLFPAKSML